MNNIRIIITLIISSFCLASCNKAEPTNIELDLKSQELIEANNNFGFNFMEAIVASEASEKNIMLSPLSVSQALSMALNGAKENTFIEMQSALDFVGIPLSEINESNKKIANSLINHDKKVKLEIANSIWYRNDITPKPTFTENSSTYYNAEVNKFDSSQPTKAMDAMNDWVKDKTNKMIDKIVDEIKDEDILFIINAIYFKAEWKTKFKKTDTTLKEFTLDNGTKKQLETMIGEAEITYKNEEKYSAIKLPYGSGKFNMIIYLPEEGYNTSDVVPELKNTDFEHLNTMHSTKMDIWFPKFEFSYENGLIDELKTLGIHDAFDRNKANFDDLCNVGAYISEVAHKTYIKTDEEGSEAVAATKITFGMTSVGPGEIIKINRSFLFAIVEEDTNSILFIGRVFDPSVK